MHDPLGRHSADRAQGGTRRRPLAHPAVWGSSGADGGVFPRLPGGSLVQQGPRAALPRGGAAHRAAGWPRLHPDGGHELSGGRQRRAP